MPKTVLAIGAHFDDCVFGVPGILLQAVRQHYRVVVLAVIGDYSNWEPTRGREKAFLDGAVQISKEFGVEMRFLTFASHRYEVTPETKRAVAEVVAELQPDVAFAMWPNDSHHDHEVAATLSKIALRHGDRIVDKAGFRAPRRIYLYDNGPRHTVGFEPNTFVDVTAEWPQAMEWLGKFMALQRNQEYNAAIVDGAQRAKETLAAYRGATCGVRYAEALWAANAYPQKVFE